MKFGWKVLIPVNVAWILVVATLRLLTQQGASQFVIAGFTGAVVLAVLGAMTIYDRSKIKADELANQVGPMSEPSFPVPALPTSLALKEKEGN
jgi:NADH-quinone oxidoreductase subunit H